MLCVKNGKLINDVIEKNKRKMKV